MTTTPPTFDTVRAALDCIPPDLGHAERVRIAFAVFDGLGDAVARRAADEREQAATADRQRQARGRGRAVSAQLLERRRAWGAA